jgi:hypothetical protein
MPPGYGYLTRHLYTGRLTLGEAVQTTNGQVLALENEEKNTAPCRNYTHVQASTATMNKNTGIQGAITNGTLVPPPQVRTTPHDWGACGATEDRRTAHRRPLQQQRWPQGERRCNPALAHADARGARTSTKSRRPEARMVAVIPSATGTSRAASASAPTTGAVSPPADPHSDPPGRAGHRPPRGGAVSVQRQGRPRTRTLPWQRATSWAVLPCARRDNRPCGRRGLREPSRRTQHAEADDARRRPAPRCRSPPLSQGQ